MPASLPPPAWLRVRPGEASLAIRLQPRAARNEIVGEHGDRLRVRVTAPPVEAAANRALLDLLAERLGCPRSQVILVRGHKARDKTVVVRGVTTEILLSRLQA